MLTTWTIHPPANPQTSSGVGYPTGDGTHNEDSYAGDGHGDGSIYSGGGDGFGDGEAQDFKQQLISTTPNWKDLC